MLSGSQIKQIREALLSAFGSRDELAMLVREELDESLAAIAGADNLRVLVFHLVQWAESTGRVAELLGGAYNQNPGNPALKQLRAAAAGWGDLDAAALPTAAGGPPAAARTAPSPTAIDIFLAYSHHNSAVMRRLYADLRGAGWSVWTDEGLEPGTPSWQDAIEEALRQARCLVVVLSPEARGSHWVNSEISYTQMLGHRIFPVLVAGDEFTAVPLGLITAQRIDARQDYRRAVAENLLPALTRFLHPVAAAPVAFDWVEIPAGPFLMGSDKQKDSLAYDDELPQHRLTLPTYRIARTPVTVAQFAAFVAATGHKTTAEERGFARVWTGDKWDDVKGADWAHPRGPDSGVTQKQDHPVTCVSWHDARAFCAWASRVTGETVRLPGEAEWEKAARGPDGRIYPWGNAEPTEKLCNFNLNVGDTTAVGSYPDGASSYGVLDMAGNVWEWTGSLWGKDVSKPQFGYPYDPDDGREDVNAPDAVRRTLRGGSFGSNDGGVRCAYRDRNSPVSRYVISGFRVMSPGS